MGGAVRKEMLYERTHLMSFKTSENKLHIKMIVIIFSTDVFLMISNASGTFFLSVKQIFSNYNFIFQDQNLFILKLESN